MVVRDTMDHHQKDMNKREFYACIIIKLGDVNNDMTRDKFLRIRRNHVDVKYILTNVLNLLSPSEDLPMLSCLFIVESSCL